MKKIAVLLSLILLLPGVGEVSGQEEIYAARRQRLMDSVEEGFLVFFSHAAPGRFDKPFYYLTGIKEANVALALIPGGEVEEVLFNTSGEWSYAAGNPGARAHPWEELSSRLSSYARGRETAHISFRSLALLPEVGRDLARLSTLKKSRPTRTPRRQDHNLHQKTPKMPIQRAQPLWRKQMSQRTPQRKA